jgi:hypothetical protein
MKNKIDLQLLIFTTIVSCVVIQELLRGVFLGEKSTAINIPNIVVHLSINWLLATIARLTMHNGSRAHLYIYPHRSYLTRARELHQKP